MDSSVYTLREFRAKTKEAFDKADEQVDVIIERNGTRYILIHETYYQELLKPELVEELVESTPEITPRVADEIVKLLPELKSYWKPCKHGADPKFCRFAKAGKPCK